MYKALDQETVYDIALKLYGDVRGVSNLLILNPGLDLNSVTFFGQEIIYDSTSYSKKEVLVVLPPEPKRPSWSVREGQSIFDLVLQIYGDIEALGKIVSQVTSTELPATFTKIQTEFTDNYLANSLFSQKIVSTSQYNLPIGVMKYYILREDGSYLLREDGSRFLREENA